MRDFTQYLIPFELEHEGHPFKEQWFLNSANKGKRYQSNFVSF